ncbi:MAG: C40 family peptidase [Acidobacteria bacterium]|nr:C40 family peptidase [Acidobacteriota bacterium]
MKGRCRTAFFPAALVFLLVSIPGFTKTSVNLPKSTADNITAKHDANPSDHLSSDQTYLVKKGDNLIRIARANQTTVAMLKSLNGLKNSRIKAGQRLIVPNSEMAPPRDSEPKVSQNQEAAARHISQLKEQALISDEESSSTRLRLVEAGFQMIGIRYRRSGCSTKTGFDCSGLVKSLFSRFDIELPRTSREQFKKGEKIDRDKLEPGDLVFFSSGGKNPTHVGIYIGNDKFLHAARKARQVIVSDLNKIWYTMRYLGARRISDLWTEQPASSSKQD